MSSSTAPWSTFAEIQALIAYDFKRANVLRDALMGAKTPIMETPMKETERTPSPRKRFQRPLGAIMNEPFSSETGGTRLEQLASDFTGQRMELQDVVGSILVAMKEMDDCSTCDLRRVAKKFGSVSANVACC
ncbi:hypothetical protein E8E12_000314 [Didymella heteroderae]|uniref:Uncharacterized protein n=1 Tax=Didymella heteroderae TaxID=1769908 RepID=A0A9P4WFZ7_9PLEO|nr:hypothetical protein E8E12_000314 [Didymella heteroderae]